MDKHASTHEQMLPAATRAQSARACFEELPTHVLSNRGRITLDPVAPFYITSCSGMAAKLLRTTSFGLAGRRLHSIAQPTEVAKLEQATRAALEMPHQCTYLSLATEARARGYSTV